MVITCLCAAIISSLPILITGRLAVSATSEAVIRSTGAAYRAVPAAARELSS